MSNERFSSVWDAVEADPYEARSMKERSILMMQLKRHIDSTGLTHAAVAASLGVTLQCVSDLVRGKIDEFSLDALQKMATAAGLLVPEN
jgi:predicted XRE-type DNA-binding protein